MTREPVRRSSRKSSRFNPPWRKLLYPRAPQVWVRSYVDLSRQVFQLHLLRTLAMIEGRVLPACMLPPCCLRRTRRRPSKALAVRWLPPSIQSSFSPVLFCHKLETLRRAAKPVPRAFDVPLAPGMTCVGRRPMPQILLAAVLVHSTGAFHGISRLHRCETGVGTSNELDGSI